MPRYMISFNDGDMTFPIEDLPDVARHAHAVMREAIEAGIWVFGGGFEGFATKVADFDGSYRDGALSETPTPLGGFCIVEVTGEDAALEWAGRMAKACRCAQEVRLIMDDPEQELALRTAHTRK